MGTQRPIVDGTTRPGDAGAVRAVPAAPVVLAAVVAVVVVVVAVEPLVAGAVVVVPVVFDGVVGGVLCASAPRTTAVTVSAETSAMAVRPRVVVVLIR
ncbi:MAG: hypothetical protein JNK05_09425 [Myxococcales bacterium]|nr:hypothetical protein [Myxococcales bacterium]